VDEVQLTIPVFIHYVGCISLLGEAHVDMPLMYTTYAHIWAQKSAKQYRFLTDERSDTVPPSAYDIEPF